MIEESGNKQINGYIKIPKINETFELNTIKIQKLMDNTGLDRVSAQMRSLFQPIELNMQTITKMTSSLQNTIQKFGEIIKPITEMMINFQLKMTPYFGELSEALKKATENPDSLLNWLNYYKKLGEYLWTFPFEMEIEELKKILEEVNSEEEFDNYMLKYFTESKLNKMCGEILEMLPRKHKIMFKQIMNSFYNGDYAISNLGVTAIIDDLCTYFLEDRGCNKREDMFLPLIEEIEEKLYENSEVIPIMILNENINIIYEQIDFRKKIFIATHKKARRHTNQHGKRFVNKKLDTIMLLNTIYYMLVVINNFSQYKGKIIYVKDRKNLERANTQRGDELHRFYLKKKYYRRKKKDSN